MHEGLSETGKRVVADVAARHGVPEDAVLHLLNALAIGGGAQAQFNHPALGGMGQWSLGGMTMVGDMFNNALKAQVDSLCNDLSQQMARGDLFSRPLPRAASSQSQWQGGASGPSFVWDEAVPDWPAELGQPASTGAQNDLRYAYFPATRRLALSVGGRIRVFDTLDHAISGFGQAQGGGQSVTFTSQHGLVRLEDLPEVGLDAGESAAAAVPPPTPEPSPAPEPLAAPTPEPAPETAVPPVPPAQAQVPPASSPAMDDDQIFSRIEKLAALHDKGILTDAEFEAKKAELLARL